MSANNYTLCLTSCGRHDLLRETLISLSRTDFAPRHSIIIEDSDAPAPAWLREHPLLSWNIQWISNGRRLGQIYSIDRMYSEVKTDYIFHCEDDWLFQGPFVSESLSILEKNAQIIQVSLRGDTGWHPLVKSSDLRIAEPYWRGVWGGITFNPGFRRTKDYQDLGSYGKHVGYGLSGLQHEMVLSKLLLDAGFRIADLGRPIATHLGGGRSKAIEPLPAMPRILIAVPACEKLEYGAWESSDSPLYDQAKAWRGQPYGKDIHITQLNDRVEAVRETWANDIKPHAAYIDLKFFYGNLSRLPNHDEAVLGCPDDYANLIRKTMSICKFAREHDYEYIFKCDDDTYVWIDRLVRELLEFRPDYGGYACNNACTGGPGYWLSKRAAGHVADGAAGQPLDNEWAEDMFVGRTMGRVGISPRNLLGHLPAFDDHWYDINKIPPGAVTIHAVRPADMRTLHANQTRQ